MKGKHHSLETKQKMSLAQKGKLPKNIELIKGWFRGKKLSETHRKNLSLSHLGNKQSDETKRKMSLAHKGHPPTYGMLGKKHSEETRRKIGLAISISQLGKPRDGDPKNWKHTEATKIKIRAKRLLQTFPNKFTSIEVKLQNLLKENNIEFSTHYPILGHPDIFIKPNIAIFADGCYWHKCPECGFGEGKERDEMVTRELQSQGFVVIRLWQHEIKNLNSLSWLSK
jgi:DNA mismatch endonuclease (patch repair protein)